MQVQVLYPILKCTRNPGTKGRTLVHCPYEICYCVYKVMELLNRSDSFYSWYVYVLFQFCIFYIVIVYMCICLCPDGAHYCADVCIGYSLTVFTCRNLFIFCSLLKRIFEDNPNFCS